MPLASSPRRILLALANTRERELFAEYLSRAGFEIQTAAAADEALALAAAHPPHAVVVDEELTGGDAIQLCDALRADHRTARAASILLATPPFLRTASCSVVVLRPVHPETLLSAAERAIAERPPEA